MSNCPIKAVQRKQGGVFADADAAATTTLQFVSGDFAQMTAFEPFDDFEEAIHFGDPVAEIQAARESAVMFDFSIRAHIEITGTDRVKFLHNFCTADIQSLAPRQGCKAFVTNAKGRVLAHIFVFATTDSLWLETVRASEEPLLEHFQRYVITEDVEFKSWTSELSELLVCGPKAIKRMAKLKLPLPEPDPYYHREDEWADATVSVRYVDWLGMPSFLIAGEQSTVAKLWTGLHKAGVQPGGAFAFHTLRVQSGFPLYGVDITEDYLAQEVSRTPQAINFKKGCYLGQEPIARIDALGHVNRELRGLRLEVGDLPSPGSSIADQEGKEIGHITSYALSPIDSHARALGYVRSEFTAPGHTVLVRCTDEWVPAEVYWPRDADVT